MTEYEAYQEHIRYTHDTYCRIVIRHASFDAARMLAARWKQEISLEYLTEEKFVPFSTTDEYFQVPDYGETYPFSVRGADDVFRQLLPCGGSCRTAGTDAGENVFVLLPTLDTERNRRTKRLTKQEEKYAAELEDALKQFSELREQAKDVDSAELSEKRIALQGEKIQSATSKIKAAYGEKFDPLILFDSKRDVSELLGEKQRYNLFVSICRKNRSRQQSVKNFKEERAGTVKHRFSNERKTFVQVFLCFILVGSWIIIYAIYANGKYQNKEEQNMGILISVITITLLVLCYVRMYNRLKRLSVKVQEGSAGIDVALEKRYDMLSEEIEAVKKYLAHEYQIYTEVTSTRVGKKLNESIFQEKKQLSEEAVKAISETITEQQKQMETIRQQLEQQRGQDNSLGAETPGMGGDGLIGHQVSLDRKLGLLASAQQGLTGINSAINALAEQYPTLYSYASVQHFQQDIFDAEEHLQAARRLYNSNVSLYNQRINTFPYLLLAKLHGMKEAKFYTVEEKKKDFKVQF